jgi:hypothetical protein
VTFVRSCVGKEPSQISLRRLFRAHSLIFADVLHSARKLEMIVARGMFRTSEGWVQVDYDGSTIPIPRSKYEENDRPEFDKLSLEAD